MANTVKREIIKKATRGAAKGSQPLSTSNGSQYSSATLGIYRSGPWSDSLATTNIKADKPGMKASGFGQGGPGPCLKEMAKKDGAIAKIARKALKKGKGGSIDKYAPIAGTAGDQMDPMNDYLYNPSALSPASATTYISPGLQQEIEAGQSGANAPLNPYEDQNASEAAAQPAKYQAPIGAAKKIGSQGKYTPFTSRASIDLTKKNYPGSSKGLPSPSSQINEYNKMPRITRSGSSIQSISATPYQFKNRNPRRPTGSTKR